MRTVRELKNLKIDEISLVDKGANQHAMVTIAKRDGEEGQEMNEFYDSEGTPVDVDGLDIGDVVYDGDGQAYEMSTDDVSKADEEDKDKESDSKKVSRKDKRKMAQETFIGKSYGDELREEFSKAMSDSDRDEVLSKAFSALDEVSAQAAAANAAAEMERDARLTAEYTEVAKGYNVGIEASELGPVLKRLTENMDEGDVEVIVKALSTASDIVEKSFDEYGAAGGGSHSDVLGTIDGMVEDMVSKSDGDFSREAAISGLFDANPEAYDEYLAERQGR